MSRLLLLSGVLLSGCVVGPRYQEPTPGAPSRFASATNGSTSGVVDEGWWKKLNDPQLNSLIRQMQADNLDLKVSEARLREARALWRQARFDLVPTVTSDAGYTNTRVSKAKGLFGKPVSTELHDIGLDASWELDLYGRVRRSVEAARATEEGLAAQRDALLVDLRSEMAVNYLLVRGGQAQLEVASENAKNQQDSLRVADASLKGGRGTQLDVARARAQWNNTLATMPQLQTGIAQSIHRLAVLCGIPPSVLREKLDAPKPLPTPPARIALSKPAEVLRHRPDIRVAERNLAAATARVGIATADLFPRVTFNGSIGLEGQTFSDLGKAGNGAYSFGPRLTWAAFDLGRVKQQIAAAGARADAALATYQQTVLEALEEAENALTAYERERQRLQYLREASKSAEEAAKLARERYRDGVASFLDVLEAERVALSSQSDVVASQTKVATAWVAVYKSMGGGWGSTSSK